MTQDTEHQLTESVLENSVADMFAQIENELTWIRSLEAQIADLDSQILDLQDQRLKAVGILDRAKFAGSPTLKALTKVTGKYWSN